MNLIPEIVAQHKQHTAWRRDIHSHPEIGFEENRTAAFVAQQLESYGINVTRGVGKTGVVGTLTQGSSNKAIGLRADMDALPVDEINTFAHKSTVPGCMHACGHDGHTVMLLAAAQYLAQSQQFNGTVHFIFQPAEEGLGGAKAMIDDGLFERFPMDNIFALHNSPSFIAGAMGSNSGALLASADSFDVTIHARGGHGAQPHEANDPLVIAAQMLMAWQTIMSRNVQAVDTAVLSACSINTGESHNVIPETVVIKGTVRTFSPAVRQLIETRFHTLTSHIASAFDATVEINYAHGTPTLVNDAEQVNLICDVAETVLGNTHVYRQATLDMGSEDFACMLEHRPGCYFYLGGASVPAEADPTKGKNVQNPADVEHFTIKNTCLVHQPDYDFNDEIIPIGATLFARLTETYLS